MTAKVWSNKKIVIEFAGIIIDSGRGKDEGAFLRIEQSGDDFGYAKSADGEEGVFFQLPGGETKATLILMQTAASNAILSALHRSSKLAGGQMSPFSVTNSGGTHATVSIAAMIQKLPDEEFAVEPGTYEWPILLHNPERLVGGN